MRQAAIRKGGEFSLENLVFKELRNNGYLTKFSDYITSKQVKELSL
jgi:REP element-mobilizing transposase RayT